MFTTPKVPCFLHMFSGHGDDNESKELKLVFHVSPITPALAIEISPHIADRLFRCFEGEWWPAVEIAKASFTSLSIPMQNIRFDALPESGDAEAVFVPGCAISNLRAQRGDSPEFRIEFDVVMPMDSSAMRLVEQYYKATCYLTMEMVQMQIEYEEDGGEQQLLQAAADELADDSVVAEVVEAEVPPKRKRSKKAEGRA